MAFHSAHDNDYFRADLITRDHGDDFLWHDTGVESAAVSRPPLPSRALCVEPPALSTPGLFVSLSPLASLLFVDGLDQRQDFVPIAFGKSPRGW
jgi:hypothetical protein